MMVCSGDSQSCPQPNRPSASRQIVIHLNHNDFFALTEALHQLRVCISGNSAGRETTRSSQTEVVPLYLRTLRSTTGELAIM